MWRHESASTARLLAELTDTSLSQRVAPGHRSIGELAWHLVTAQRGILAQAGLLYDAPDRSVPPPARASQIQSAYVDAAQALAQAVEQQWTDETLKLEDPIYGQRWPRGLTLAVMLHHEIHHRGQLTVLMRRAGLRVPGMYGPSKDEKD